MGGFQCDTCDRWLSTFHGRQQHMNTMGHCSPEYECDICDRSFGSRSALEQHMEAVGHWYGATEQYDDNDRNGYEVNYNFHFADDRHEPKFNMHFHCVDCDRHFSNGNSIAQHMNSHYHRSGNIECPFCKRGYNTATGLCGHLEAGACPRAPMLDRDQVYRVVRSKDPGGVISKHLIGWHGSPTYEADDRTWNGQGYECYLCRRDFSQLSGLNQHLASPIHQQDLYHCPNRSRCGKDFTSLAAVMNHLESESCGFTRFETVQRGVKNMVSGNHSINF